MVGRQHSCHEMYLINAMQLREFYVHWNAAIEMNVFLSGIFTESKKLYIFLYVVIKLFITCDVFKAFSDS